MIKPYIPLMTKSELHAVMTGGFATIAGSVLAAFISFGVDPTHLLAASVMSAPAALAFAKLFYPETEQSRTSVKDIQIERGQVMWLSILTLYTEIRRSCSVLKLPFCFVFMKIEQLVNCV